MPRILLPTWPVEEHDWNETGILQLSRYDSTGIQPHHFRPHLVTARACVINPWIRPPAVRARFFCLNAAKRGVSTSDLRCAENGHAGVLDIVDQHSNSGPR